MNMFHPWVPLSLLLIACSSDPQRLGPVAADAGVVDGGATSALTWNVKALDNGHVQALAMNDAGLMVATLDWDATLDQQEPTVTTVPEYMGREQELVALARKALDAPDRVRAARPVAEIDLAESVLKANAGTARPAEELRGVWGCYHRLADASYNAVSDTPASVCSLVLDAPSANDVGKLYVNEAAAGTVAVIAIAGTRATVADIRKDIESQIVKEAPASLLGAATVANGKVGRGWMLRWQQAAMTGIPAKLKALEDSAEARGVPFEVIVTGHSLGGATGAVAALDVVHFLRGRSNKHHVRLVTFNAPKLGDAEIRKSLQEAMLVNAPQSPTGTELSVHKFERGFDPVHWVPAGFNYVQPFWNEAVCSKQLGEGPFADQTLGDSPMVFASEVTKVPWKLGSNHKLGDWLEEISGASDAQLGCISNL